MTIIRLFDIIVVSIKTMKAGFQMHPLRNKDADTQRILLRIGASLKEKLQEISDRESRSMNYLINEAIAEYVENHL